MKPYPIILIIVSIFVLFFYLGERHLLSSGESRAGEIAIEMMQTGNYLIPQLNEEILLTKPPLFHWMIIACYKIMGINEFSSRFISAVSGVLTILLVYLIGLRFWGKDKAFLAGLILLTSPIFFWEARCARIDSLLLFFITLSMYFFWRGYEKYPNGRHFFVFMFISMGFGALAKGHLAIAAPIITIILFFIYINKKALLKKMQWLWGLLIIFAIVAPWFIAIYFLVPKEKADIFFLKQNETWFSCEGEWYKGYMYIFHFILGFFPWSIALPAVLLSSWNDFKKKEDKTVFLLFWSIVIFAIFFLTGKKVGRYILPMYPAMALLTANIIYGKKNINKIILFSLSSLLFLSLVSSMYAICFKPVISSEFLNILVSSFDIKLLIVLILAFIFSIYGIKKQEITYILVIIILSLTVFTAYFIPAENKYYSPKPFCEMLKKELPNGAVIRGYQSWDNTLRYYYGKHVDRMNSEDELRAFLNTRDKVYCFMWEKIYKKLPEDLRQNIFLVKEGYRVLDNKVILVSNKKQ